MGITVIAQCPKCKKTIEHNGQHLSAVELATKESWVIECILCNHVFLHGIGDKG
ncbi:hypothetical protein KAU43_05870 [candidate division WOR-3 bacterium]|nr:hypothetical protein [candidate division WOR-3 bacterium]